MRTLVTKMRILLERSGACVGLCVAASAISGVSCTASKPAPIKSGGASAYFNYDRPASLPSNPNNVEVKVSLRNQMAYVMEGNRPLLVTPVSVGRASTPTPRGNFRVYSKEAKRRANGHGYAYSGNQARQTYLNKKPPGWSFKGTPMPYWVEFKSGYGFHTGWMKHTPCTHGCLRLHENVSPKFFRLVSSGTKINIADAQPEDATIGRNVPRPPDATPLPDYPTAFMLSDGYFTKHKVPRFN